MELMDAIKSRRAVRDYTDAPPQTFESLIEGTRQSAGNPNSAWHHPMIRQVVLVTNWKVLKAAAAGFDSDPFGNLKVPTFATLDEALDYARAQGA